ncbi:MAG: efflux RND transporter periplasmic adaptor subunit [Burkholderiales bacterium]|nr:efflux RND transporter periplasmic adaptor subunit [Burkholderiales bacterium]
MSSAPSGPQGPAAEAKTMPESARTSSRARALVSVMAVILLMALAYGLYWQRYVRGRETTDNAYVHAPLVPITSQVAATVVAVMADDTDAVKTGQLMVRLDPADAQVALARAEAQLGQAVREARVLYVSTLAATIRTRQADVERAQTEVQRARDDLVRRQPLVSTGAIGAEEMKHTEATLATAQGVLSAARAALDAAREQAVGNRALTGGTEVARHPSVLRAAAAVREAWLAVERCEVMAPLGGQVAKRTVQVGQRVAAGSVLMTVVPLEQAWVEANFKEVQLRDMRVGQPVRLEADVYGDQVVFNGKVAGLGAGTGAAFAVLPAQNASGNWVKVVQRVPVRVEIDAAQLARHPLRVGLSMHATVDVSDTAGAPIAPKVEPAARIRTTDVFATASAAADRRIEDIVARNLVAPVAGAARR